MQNLTRIQKWFKALNVTRKDRVYVGMDVHKNSISVAVWLIDRVIKDFRAPADYDRLIKTILPLKKAIRMIVYEAGPTGYGLARTLQHAGLPVQVIAPSNTPRSSKRQSKTDRLDCKQLAKYAAKGMLQPVTIPTEQEEADRQLSRLRDQYVCKSRRVKQQIRSLLLQYTLPDPDGWSNQTIRFLKELSLAPALRLALDMYLEELGEHTVKIDFLESEIKRLARQSPHCRTMAILTSHPGVGLITAWAFATELFRPERFGSSGEVASYLGLAPRIYQSGQTRRDGPITKTGRAEVRAKLIQASWSWIRQDPAARKVYNRIFPQTGNGNKAIVAMARRLAIHLWRMACTNQYYKPAA